MPFILLCRGRQIGTTEARKRHRQASLSIVDQGGGFHPLRFNGGVKTQRQGQQVGCLEEIAFDAGWITKETLREAAATYAKNDYGEYLLGLLEGQQR